MPKKAVPARGSGSPSFLRKSIDQLEGCSWGEPDYDSYVVRTVHALRTKPLCTLTDEELRLALRQQVGLPWVIELAVERLHEDIFRAGDFHPGDILAAALKLPAQTWREQPDLARRMTTLAHEAQSRLDELDDLDCQSLDEALDNFLDAPQAR